MVSGSARKRPRIEESKLCSKTCVICQETVPVAELNKPKDIQSWTTLLKAAEMQKFSPILFYKSCTEVPDISYHLEYRKIFVHKKRLQRLKVQEEMHSASEEHSHEPRLSRDTARASLAGRVYGEICIFCKKTMYQKRSHSREPLCKAVDLRCDTTLKKTAQEKMDKRMMAITSREVVAAEVHYHRTCYRLYTKQEIHQQG